ncbi:hypothetical protein QQS21_006526 [Conoideocrella luteorostrata]|uniref:Probable glucan endo-1,3-beta-glucosidase eglC n=1 Tax=Conoideocrella luteorostrata TaxID=1105319 RepID=A0AAJ0CN92_9HYPO|nr:hypothetical protein QQS21_006526 [Conoideocrella luteorostrata]
MTSRLLSLATAITGASAAFQGFNYGDKFTDGRAKVQSDYEAEFKAAAGLEGTNGGFTSGRLYTMIQGGTPNQPISAIPAAIKTKTSLLLGLWASAGQAAFNNELAALKSTADQYCDQLDGLIAGISVGSEDLYRISPIGQAASPDPGAAPEVLVNYIKEVRNTIKGTCLEKAPIGHVDTWTAYVNVTNKPVIDAIDWIGMDAYPYYENTKPNGLENAAKLFQAAIDNTKSTSGGKPIWITETGWPVSGPKENQAVPGTDAAQTFWREVGCPMFGNTNVWWFTLQDGAPTIPSPAFGVIGSTLTTKPLYDLSCKGHENKPSRSSSSSSQSSQAAASSSEASGTESVNPPASTSGAQKPTTAASQPGSSAQPTSQGSTVPSQSSIEQSQSGQPTSAPPASTMATSPGGGIATTIDGGSVTVAPPPAGTTSAGGASTTPVTANAGKRMSGFAGLAVGVVMAAAAL